jgi:hypothetical protein
MIRRSFTLMLVSAGIGCSPDPCANVTGACITAEVVGRVSSLDQLDVSIGNPVNASRLVPSAARPITLPTTLGIELPANTDGNVAVQIAGKSAGRLIATSGVQQVAVPHSAHVKYSFTLRSSTFGGPGNMANPTQPGDMTDVATMNDAGISGDMAVVVPTAGSDMAKTPDASVPIVPPFSLAAGRHYESGGKGSAGPFAYTGVVTVDLDGKNGPDFAVTERGTGDVTVFLNHGDGTFDTTGTKYHISNSALMIATGDFDGKNGPEGVSEFGC